MKLCCMLLEVVMLAMVLAPPAHPRAVAVVDVAIAVDDLKQTQTPSLPDTLGGDATPFVPQPTVDACRCGCQKPDCRCGKPAAALLPSGRKVVTMYSPKWCSNCPAWKKYIGPGDDAVEIRVVEEEAPTHVEHYPSLWYDGKLLRAWTRSPTLAEIKAHLPP